MRPVLIKVSLGILACLVVAIIAAAIMLHPYYAMPPESKEALDTKLAEYRKIALEMQNRPKAGRQAMDSLIDDLKSTYVKDAEKPWVESCPAYDIERLTKLEPLMRKFMAFDGRFHALVENGLVIQQDFFYESDLPNFSGPRGLAFWENGAAVLDLLQDRRDEALQRIHAVLRFAEALFQTPTILYAMVGVAIEKNANQMLVHLLPRLTPAEMEQIKGWLTGLPDVRIAMVAAMKTEVASSVSILERENQPTLSDTFSDNLFHNKYFSRMFIWLARNTGYLQREKYMFLSLTGQEIRAAQTWSAASINDVYKSPITSRDIMHSLFTAIGWPNYTKLLARAGDDMRHRQALLKAMDLELKRRESGPPTFELPYDGEQHIVVKPEYGCIVKNENTPGAAPAVPNF